MKKIIRLIVLLIAVLFLNIYFRMFTVNFPQLKINAKNTVQKKIIGEAVENINKKFPKFDDLAKDELINKLIDENNKKDRQAINGQIRQEYRKLKHKYQDAAGQTYLMELDCWHWARYVENVICYGHPGDRVVNGRQIDDLMLAPLGSSLPFNRFLFYLSACLYEVFSFFKTVPLFTFLFYLPLFFAAVFIIVLYLICFYHWGNLSAVAACLFIGLSPVFITRSHAGWFDMDILSLLFPLLIAWSYAKSHEIQSGGQKFLWVCFSGFWVGLFSFTWINWWFIFLIIILYESYSLINSLFEHWRLKKKNISLLKQRFFSLSLFISISFVWVISLSGFIPLKVLYKQVAESIVLNDTLKEISIWPNVYYTVEELGRVRFKALTNMIGDEYLLIFSAVCMFIIAARFLFTRRYKGFTREFVGILVFWFIVMVFACSKGVRFIMFLLIPLGVSSGLILQQAYEYLRNVKRKIIVVFVAIITGFLLGNCLNNAYDTAGASYPLMRDSYYKILSRIEESTPKGAVINSWWDYGDWFKVVAKRRVVFDGQSQNVPQAYWMAYVLLNSDEQESIRILRMLDNSGNKGFAVINSYFNDPVKTVLFVKELLITEPWVAKEVLKNVFPPSLAQEAIGAFFNTPVKSYLIVDASMENKLRAISYIGGWDFAKVYIAQNIGKESKSKIISYLRGLSIGAQEADRLYNEARLIPKDRLDSWFTESSKFHSGLLAGREKSDFILFNQGVVYKPREKLVYIYSNKHKRYQVPRSLFVFENDKLDEITYADNDLSLSILVMKNEEGYQAILMDHKLATSLFVRLFYLKGAGLKKFKPFLQEGNDGGFFRVFEIVWD